jgi:O-antigen ligase
MLLAAFALLLAGLIRSLSSGAIARLAGGVVALGAGVALVGVVQYATLGDHAFGGMKIYGVWQPESALTTPFGPFVNKNHFAGWMLMAVPLAIGLALAEFEAFYRAAAPRLRDWLMWLSTPRGGYSLLLLFAALFMTLSAVMTRSRSGLGGLAVIALLTCVVAARRLRSKTAGVTAVAVSATLAGAIVLLAGQDSALTQTRIAASPLAMRLDVWRMSWHILRDFIVLGTGLNTFGTATILYQSAGDLHYYEAHNDYLQLAVEGGAVMAVLVLLAILLLGLAIRRRFREDHVPTDLYWIRVGATLGLIAIGLQSIVEFSLQMPGNAALFAALIAMAFYSPQQSPHAR